MNSDIPQITVFFSYMKKYCVHEKLWCGDFWLTYTFSSLLITNMWLSEYLPVYVCMMCALWAPETLDRLHKVFKNSPITGQCPLNILPPKNKTHSRMPQKAKFSSNCSNDFDQMSLISGDHHPKQICIAGSFCKIMLLTLGVQAWNINFLENGLIDTD
jgi:hypothetical protein